jgi:hypothetical protein
MRNLLLLLAFLPFAAAAADDPEAVYAKVHRATLAGNTDEVLSHATAARRKEMAALPGKEDMVRMVAMTLPKAYSVTKRDVAGRKATLELRGVHDSAGPARGRATLFREKGEWRVDEWYWDTQLAADEPRLVRVQSPAVPPKAPAPEEPMKPAMDEGKDAASAALVPVDAPTLRRTSAEARPCVIKPVMTDDDLRRCGATPPRYDDK